MSVTKLETNAKMPRSWLLLNRMRAPWGTNYSKARGDTVERQEEPGASWRF